MDIFKKKLAEKLYDMMYTVDYYGCEDCGYTLEYAEESIEKNPDMVIDGLLDIIEVLYAKIEA